MRSLGEAAGLQAGDIIFSVDGQDISLLKHKEAQEAIKTAGHNFVLTVGRYDHAFFLTILRSGPVRNKRVILAESFYYVNYGSSIIASKVSQIISVMKT